MALATKPRRSQKSAQPAKVDPATVPIEHDLYQGYRHHRGRHGRIIVKADYGVPEFESVMLPADRPRTKKMVQDYLAIETVHTDSIFSILMFLVGLEQFWMWLRPIGRLFYTINATDRGGGVVMMNVDLQAHCDAYGVPMRWDNLEPDKVAFLVTKRCFHNPLHGIESPPPVRDYPRWVRGLLIALLWACPLIGRFNEFPMVFEGVAATKGYLTSTDKLIYRRWIARCFWLRMWAMAGATDISLEDWQTARFARYARGWGLYGVLFRMLRLVRGRSLTYNLFFRDHIDTQWQRLAAAGSPANFAWLYSWYRNKIMWADRFIAHHEKFVPLEVRRQRPEMAVIMRATSSLLDEHNRRMTAQEELQVQNILNDYLIMTGQRPLSFKESENLVCAISRYCPPKRHDLALQLVVRMNQILHYEYGWAWEDTIKLQILGFGSKDDRDGIQVFDQIWKMRSELPEEERQQILVLRTGHLDLLKNVVLKHAKLGVHTADAEGVENNIGDGGHHGTPYFVRPEGGPSTQIVHGESGLVMPWDLETWARAGVEFFTNQELRDRLTAGAKYHAERKLKDEFTTVCNMQNFLWLCLNPHAPGNSRLVRDLVKSDYEFAA